MAPLVPLTSVARHTGPATPLTIDGRLDDPACATAPWTADFVDIEGTLKPTPRFRTRAKILWDDTSLSIAAELTEPHLWAKLTQHDAVIFQDPDFEVFLDPTATPTPTTNSNSTPATPAGTSFSPSPT